MKKGEKDYLDISFIDMGISTKKHCNNCGHDFTREYGVGIDGHAVLYCDRCGKPMNVDFSGGWVTLPDCECGGHFDADAKGRCPKCGSTDIL